MKKVLFAIDSNTAGGAERQIVTLANSFCRHEYDVVLVNSDTASAFNKVDEKIKIIKMGVDSEKKRLKRLILKYKNMKVILEKTRPDVVVVFLFNMELPTILACQEKKIPVCTAILDNGTQNVLSYIFRKIFYNRIDGVVFQTETIRKLKFFKKVKRYAIIPNPIQQDLVADSPPVEYEKRKDWIISAGRLVWEKDQAMLVRVFEKIAEEDEHIELHIFGEGPLKESLQLQIQKSQFSERIFLDGVEHNVMKNHRDAKAFAFTSLMEGYPNALIEAMANGIPVISTAFARKNAYDIIQNGIDGYVCENEDDYILKIKQILYNPQISMQFSINAARISNKLNTEKIFRQWEQFLFQKSM